MNGTPHISPRGPTPVGPYPHARRVGDFLFISGIGPRRRDDKDIPGVTRDAAGNVTSYDIAAQCRSVFENIRVIIEDAGAKWENIVDVTSFLTDMKRDFAEYNRVYEEHLGHVRPTRTTVEVRALPTQINVELKVIAWVGK
jgi:2-aminomuconate deaminase